MPAAFSDAISVMGMNRSVMSAAQSTQGASTRPLSDAARFVKTQPSAVERTQAKEFFGCIGLLGGNCRQRRQGVGRSTNVATERNHSALRPSSPEPS
jgi:hypothetical protein